MRKIAVCGALFAIFLFILPLFATNVSAGWIAGQAQDFDQTIINADTSNRVQKEGYDSNTMYNMMQSLRLFSSGSLLASKDSPFSVQRSALGSINNFILAMYTNPPANTYMALQDIGNSLGFIAKPAYAQGVGFSGLAPLIPIWRVFRNIAYVLLAMVMIVIGFMVMFRRKIDPKTVVTVQNALPRIVLTLLLVTFSYAIVGIMIDLMYIVLLLAFGLFQSTGLLPESRTMAFGINLAGAPVRDVILSGNLFQAFHIIFPSNIFSIENMANTILTGGNWDIINQVLNAVPSVLFGVILSLALLFTFIRLFILFLSAYVQIILSLLFGPIQILMGAIPGVDGFGGWFKNLIASLSVFPVAGVLFMLSIVFAEAGSKSGGANNTIWAPPYYTLANSSVASITALFSIGVLMMIPSIAGSIKKALKATGIPAGPGALLAPVGGAAGTGMQLSSTLFQINQLTGGKITDFLTGRKPSKP